MVFHFYFNEFCTFATYMYVYYIQITKIQFTLDIIYTLINVQLYTFSLITLTLNHTTSKHLHLNINNHVVNGCKI